MSAHFQRLAVSLSPGKKQGESTCSVRSAAGPVITGLVEKVISFVTKDRNRVSLCCNAS
jgi:hypothetical protein